MPDNYIWNDKSGNSCINLNGANGSYCFPIVISCQETDDDGFLMDCDKLYCDLKCSWEVNGVIPYVAGDKIMIQTQFRDISNPDPKIPIFGWGDWVFIEIWDADTNTLWSDETINTTLRGYVCHNGTNSYQVIEVDTSLEGFPCTWYAKIYAYQLDIDFIDDTWQVVGDPVELYCRQTHNFIKKDSCSELHEVEGLYTDFDCLGNYYGESCENFLSKHADAEFFQYRNNTRIEGGTVKRAPEYENDEGNSIITDNYSFTTAKADQVQGVFLPNYIITWYLNIFSAKYIKIDNNTIFPINFALNTLDVKENSAVVEFNWQQKCSNCYE